MTQSGIGQSEAPQSYGVVTYFVSISFKILFMERLAEFDLELGNHMCLRYTPPIETCLLLSLFLGLMKEKEREREREREGGREGRKEERKEGKERKRKKGRCRALC
jgi:hypothetical protein